MLGSLGEKVFLYLGIKGGTEKVYEGGKTPNPLVLESGVGAELWRWDGEVSGFGSVEGKEGTAWLTLAPLTTEPHL